MSKFVKKGESLSYLTKIKKINNIIVFTQNSIGHTDIHAEKRTYGRKDGQSYLQRSRSRLKIVGCIGCIQFLFVTLIYWIGLSFERERIRKLLEIDIILR